MLCCVYSTHAYHDCSNVLALYNAGGGSRVAQIYIIHVIWGIGGWIDQKVPF